MIMETDSDKIRKLGEKMMSGFGSSEQSSEEPKSDKGMFDMPSFDGGFGGNEKQSSGFEMPSFGGPQVEKKPQPTEQPVAEDTMDSEQESQPEVKAEPKPDSMFGDFDGGFGGEPKKSKKKDDFGGMGTSDDAEALKKLGDSMMG